MSKIRLKLYAYDHRILDRSIADIIECARRTGAQVRGPVLLPTKISRYTILRSTNIDKKSREQFEIRTHKRFIDIINLSRDTMEALMRLELPTGVEVKIKTIVD